MARITRSRLRSLTASLKFALTFLVASLRDRPLKLRPVFGSRAGAILTPDGRFLPQIAGGAPDPPADPDPKDPDPKDPANPADPKDPDPADPPADPKDPDPDPTKVDPEDDWKTKSRKNENRAKQEQTKREEAEKKLREREEEDESEAQKKVREAKEEGRQEALTETQKEARSTRLESAVTKAAVKKLKLGEGDDAEEARFADPEDAQILIERAIAKGELEEDEVFNDKGQVDQEVIERELASFLKRKSHLREEAERPDPGDPDTRKGDPADESLNSMSVEDHVKRKYGADK